MEGSALATLEPIVLLIPTGRTIFDRGFNSRKYLKF